jgi:NADH-quinone oxidoreductase subunit L
MRKISGLKRVLPWTNVLILIGCFALAGFPVFSGFFSKDEIIHHAMQEHPFIGVVMLVAAFMTAYYTFRLYFRVFQGPEMIPDAIAGHGHGHGHDDAAHGHDDHAHHNHEPMIMVIPLIVLAIGALLAGYLNWPKEGLAAFLGHSPSFQLSWQTAQNAGLATDPAAFGQHAALANAAEVEHSPFSMVMLISALISIAGIALAWWLHLKNRAAAERLAENFRGLVRLMDHKFWVDEIYQNAIVEPLRKLGVFFFAIDRFIVDGLVWLVSFIPQLGGFAL